MKDCQELTSSQPEADTKIALHVCNLLKSSGNIRNVQKQVNRKIKIRATDTDVLVILLANIKDMQNPDDEVWMELGVANKRRFINVSGMRTYFGDRFCNALPALHALSGSDFTPSFFKRGKKAFVDRVYKNESYKKAWCGIADPNNFDTQNFKEFIETDVFKTLEKLVCDVYGYKGLNCLHKTRLRRFEEAFKERHPATLEKKFKKH